MAASKVASNRPPNAGNGRPKGARNKVTRELKEMILVALEQAGGQEYLTKQAKENPRVFLALLARLLPREPAGADAAGLAAAPPAQIIVQPVRSLHELEQAHG